MIFALVKSGLVTNVIVADQSFIDAHPGLYDVAVDVSAGPQPSVGDAYSNGVFTSSLTLAQAKAQVIAQGALAIQCMVDAAYSTDVRLNLMAIYHLAVDAGNLPNRVAYIKQLFTWAQAVVTYAASVQATVMAKTTVADVLAVTLDFNQISVPDPKITGAAAIAINS